jgi:hypothetical protein
MLIKGLKMNDLVAIEKIAQWEKLKTLVLDSVSSAITKRVYNMALNEFMAWFQQAPRGTPGGVRHNTKGQNREGLIHGEISRS